LAVVLKWRCPFYACGTIKFGLCTWIYARMGSPQLVDHTSRYTVANCKKGFRADAGTRAEAKGRNAKS
jgi:hypothetical protein